ncbi:MAG: hypothetical protein DMG13_15920 [Acidobacteria bacterium]|nr:MAG: hypothetical protein DMG13_15920 [Acidobacteriota bacterium]
MRGLYRPQDEGDLCSQRRHAELDAHLFYRCSGKCGAEPGSECSRPPVPDGGGRREATHLHDHTERQPDRGLPQAGGRGREAPADHRRQRHSPHGIALDPKNKLIFVSNFGNADLRAAGGRYGKFEPPSITVYPMEASGNVKPVRIIEGPKALMNWPAHMAFHEERQELFVANDADNSILVFRGSDQGDAAPIRVIKGPKTGIKSPPGIALDAKLGELYVANMGTPSVTVFQVTANGDVPPVRTIRGAAAGAVGLMIGNPGRLRLQTGTDSRAQLSGSSADCDIRQVGERRTSPSSSTLWSGQQTVPNNARRPLRRGAR